MTSARDDSARAPSPERPSPTGVLVGFGGDPLTVGLIFFGIASVALGMALIGMPTTAQGAVIPIIVLGSGLYQLVVTIWAAVLGQSIVAVIFSTFSAFWLSFSALVLGLIHGWPTPCGYLAAPPDELASSCANAWHETVMLARRSPRALLLGCYPLSQS